MRPDTVAVTGVSGTIGSGVARALGREGLPLRLVARRPDQVPEDLTGERAQGSYAEPESMTRALAGAATLFLVAGREHPDRHSHHHRTVTAAVAAGVARIVYLSVLGAGPAATFTLARQHFHTEEAIRASGVDYVFLRASLYSDFLPYLVGRDGVIRAPAGEGRVSLVARDDIVRVVTAVVTDPSEGGVGYDVTGPEAVTLREAAKRLSGHVGRQIRYEPETEADAYVSRSVYRAPAWEVEGWVTSYLAVAKGEMDTVASTVPDLTGRPATSIDAFLAAHPESYMHLTV